MSELNLKAALAEVEKGESFCLESKADIGRVLRAFAGLEQEKTYKRGDFFAHEGSEYVLASVGYNRMLLLINIETGSRHGEPTGVSDTSNVTEAEFDKICEGNPHEFSRRGSK